jgi:parallel beta-helix repeat protein
MLTFTAVAFTLWYENLPAESEIRERYKLGKFLTKFEFVHLFYDWRNLGIPIYDLTTSRKDMDKIINSLPSKDSLLTDEYKKYIKAEFSYNGQIYDNVKLKIRGLSPNHWVDEKKSWRIKFNSKDLFEHKKSLNLIIPQDRGLFAEYLSNHIARKMGLWVPDDKFVFLRINNVLQGIYYEIEHPTNKFLELHSKVDSANYYQEDNWDMRKYGYDPIFSDVGHWKKNSSETVSQFNNYAELDYLLFLLNKADDNKFYREIPALVNMDNFLTWQAHSMIMGSYHQSEHGNINLYFNIIDGKFELIPNDVNMFPFVGKFFDKPYNPFIERVLKNPEYLHRRNLILWRYINDTNNLKDDLQFYDNAYNQFRKAFYADRKKGFTNLHFDKEVNRSRNTFLSNREKIISNLSFANLFANIHLFPGNSRVLSTIDMISQGFSAAEMLELKVSFDKKKDISGYPDLYLYYDSNSSGLFENTDKLITKLSKDTAKGYFKSDWFSFLLYSGRDRELHPAKRYYKFFIVSPEQHMINQEPIVLELVSVNAVTKEKFEPRYHYIDDRTLKNFSEITKSQSDFIAEHPIFKEATSYSNANTLIISQGKYNIDKTIIIPVGVNVIIEPGAVLKFSKGISFISYGKIVAKGTKEKPIVFTALDNKEPWGNFGVVGHGADDTELEHVIVEHGGESFINGIYFTGAIAVHSARAKISNCIFRYNTGDDVINTKTGESNIQDSVFYKNRSDGADYDFSRGKVISNYFKDNGGDAVDLARSDIYIDNNRIEGSGDKGISVGEASNPIIVNNLIRLCNIGIASKDRANPTIVNNTIVDNNNGIEAYMKKPVFGPANGIIRNTILWNNKKTLEVDKSSKLDISNSIIQGGYKGKDILTTEPKFVSEKDGNYQLALDEINNELLVSKGDLEPLRYLPQYKDIKEVPIGILSNPKLLSTSDFNSE